VEYWYAQVETWQTTLPDGIEVYHFASGQTEARHPSGSAEVREALTNPIVLNTFIVMRFFNSSLSGALSIVLKPGPWPAECP
jgi:hypothetical protein